MIMKKVFLKALAIFAFAGLFASCEKPQQSELTLDSVEGMARIQGKVTYFDGVKKEAGVITYSNEQLAVGQIVVARVAMDSYVSGSVGANVYTDTIDADGKYCIEIPVTKTNSATLTLEVLPFYADYNYVDPDYNVQTLENQLYNYALLKDEDQYLGNYEFSLNDKGINVQDIVVYCNPETELELTDEITVNGEVVLYQGWKKNDEEDASNEDWNYWFVDDYVALGDCNLTVWVQIEYNDKYYQMQYTDGIKTDSKGNFTTKVKVPTNVEYNDIVVVFEAKTYLGTISHKYWNIEDGIWRNSNVDVVYYPYGDSSTGRYLDGEVKLFKTVDLGTLVMDVKPTEDAFDAIKGIGNDVDFDEDYTRLYHTYGNYINSYWRGNNFYWN